MEWRLIASLHFIGVFSAAILYGTNVTSFLGFSTNATGAAFTSRSNSSSSLAGSAIHPPEGYIALGWTVVFLSSLYATYLVYMACNAVFGKTKIINTPRARDVGYLLTPGSTKRDIANMVRRRRNIGDIPPPYPNGWYEVIRSSDLPVGTSKAVSLIGHHFAVFRRENGHVTVMDAYCPHLGANLGVGGMVRGNCIECPFHGWQFDGDTGQCTSIPYAEKVPSFAKTKVWPSLEVNETVFVWYDVDGKEPWFYPESLIKENKNWLYKGFTYHQINCHCQDISENAADVSHLKAVHEFGVQTGTRVNYKKKKILGSLLVHEWKVKWEPLPSPSGHVGRMSVFLTNKLFGIYPLKFLDVNVIADQIGPTIVHLKFDMFLGKGCWIHTTVPEEPMLQRMTHYLYCDWWIPTFLANWILLSGEAVQIERDALIWDNKTYMAKPMLVKEDNLILAHRRWFSQFYSKNSIKVSSAMKNEQLVSW